MVQPPLAIVQDQWMTVRTPTSIATDQRVQELSAHVEAVREKCTRYDAIEAKVRLMRRMLTQLCPSFPTMSMVRSLNYSVCCVSYLLDICMCMFIKYGNVDCGPMIMTNTMLFFP